MLEVPTYLDRSGIHGIGLFAARPIRKGTRIWSYHPEIDLQFTETQWRALLDSLHPVSARRLEIYTYKSNDRYYLCTDDAQFMNHSNSPNVLQHDREDIMFAGTDILVHAELTCNYFHYSDPDDPGLALLVGNRIQRRYSAGTARPAQA